MNSIPLEEIFRDFSTEDFLRALVSGGDSPQMSRILDVIATQVQGALSRRFGDFEQINNATQSAFRTFVRRLRVDQQYHLDQPDAIVRLLVRIACNKAIDAENRSRTMATMLEDVSVPFSSSVEQSDFMGWLWGELDGMLEVLEGSLKNESERAVLPYWFLGEIRNEPLSNQEIMTLTELSESTILRAKRSIERRWQPIVQAFREQHADLL